MKLSRPALFLSVLGSCASVSMAGDEHIVVAATVAPGAQDILVVNRQGCTIGNLTTDTDLEARNPQVSPDGSKIAFNLINNSGLHELWIMNADGTGKMQLPPTPTAFGPQAFPWLDNQELMYRYAPTVSSGDVRVINVQTHADQLLVSASSLGESSIDYCDISPNRKKLVVAAQAGSAAETLDIYVLNSDGSNPSMLYGDSGNSLRDSAPAWGNDSTVYWTHFGTQGEEMLVSKSLESELPPSQFDRVLSTAPRMGVHAVSPSGTWLVLRQYDDYVLFNTITSAQSYLLSLDDYFYGDWAFLDHDPSGGCPGDLDGDCDCDVFDFALLATNFGCLP